MTRPSLSRTFKVITSHRKTNESRPVIPQSIPKRHKCQKRLLHHAMKNKQWAAIQHDKETKGIPRKLVKGDNRWYWWTSLGYLCWHCYHGHWCCETCELLWASNMLLKYASLLALGAQSWTCCSSKAWWHGSSCQALNNFCLGEVSKQLCCDTCCRGVVLWTKRVFHVCRSSTCWNEQHRSPSDITAKYLRVTKPINKQLCCTRIHTTMKRSIRCNTPTE